MYSWNVRIYEEIDAPTTDVNWTLVKAWPSEMQKCSRSAIQLGNINDAKCQDLYTGQLIIN